MPADMASFATTTLDMGSARDRQMRKAASMPA
jgi:hypothetical protein